MAGKYPSYGAPQKVAGARPVQQRMSLFGAPQKQQGMGGGVAAPKATPLRPRTDQQQAAIDVSAAYNPVIKQLTDQITQQAKAGMGAIGGYTQQLAGQLGQVAPQLEGIYGRAQQAQASTDAALAGGLRDSSNAGADQLAQQLAQAGLGGTGVAEQERATGMGAAGGLQGMGSASLSQLISQGAASSAYGASMPATARLGGLAGARELSLSSQKDIADQTGSIRAQIPGAVIERADQLGAVRRENSDRAYTRQQTADATKYQRQQDTAAAKYQAQQDAAKAKSDAEDRAFERDLAVANGLLDQQKVNQPQIVELSDGSIVAVDPNTAKTTVVKGALPPKPGKPYAKKNINGKNGSVWEYDPNTGNLRQIAKPGTTGVQSTAKGKGKDDTSKTNGLSATAYASKKQQGLEAARIFYEGKENAQGVVTASPIEYQDAVKRLVNGYSLKLEDAVKIADNYWDKGESDRPFLDYKAREALRGLGIPDRVIMAAMHDQAKADRLLTTAGYTIESIAAQKAKKK